jgi:hypothetical protein
MQYLAATDDISDFSLGIRIRKRNGVNFSSEVASAAPEVSLGIRTVRERRPLKGCNILNPESNVLPVR